MNTCFVSIMTQVMQYVHTYVQLCKHNDTKHNDTGYAICTCNAYIHLCRYVYISGISLKSE